MDERKKLTFTVILGIAGLWFIFTNFCLPTLKDNTERLAEYRKLREDTRLIEDFNDEVFRDWDGKLSQASEKLEKKFLGEGKMKLAEQLTRLPLNSEIEFVDIKQKESQRRGNYEVFPVDITVNAEFLDLIRYLAILESSPLLVGVDDLRISKVDPDSRVLDVKLTFVGFRLISSTKPVIEYLEERFTPFDEVSFTNLIQPIEQRQLIKMSSISGLYNPFLSVYDTVVVDRGPSIIKTDEELSLRGTLRIAGKNAALINEALVREGDRIDGMEVVQIGDGKVVLMRSGKRRILKMGVQDGFIRP